MIILPLPTFIPKKFAFMGGSIFLSDLLVVVLVALIALSWNRLQASSKWTLFASIGIFSGATLLGLANGASIATVVRDGRDLFHVVILAIVLSVLLSSRSPKIKRILLGAVTLTVLYTFVVVIIESTLKLGFFNVRSSEAILYTSSGVVGSDTARIIPASGLFCVVTAAVLFAMWSLRLVSFREYRSLWAVIVAGICIGFLGFSRNSLIGLAAVLVAALLVGLFRGAPIRMAGATALMSIVGLTAIGVSSLVTDSVTTTVNSWGNAFEERVLTGLNPEVLETDSSSNWRQKENRLAVDYISQNWAGSGLGAPYRARVAGEPFEGNYGQTYIHNSYLWLPLKIGVTLSTVVAAFGLVAAYVVIRAKNRLAAVVKLTMCGLAPVMLVTPVPFSTSGSVLTACVGGMILNLVQQRKLAKVAR
ncbi:O-antigen ligase family protein [Arthrobacter sp. AOP36-A1-22]|uniref:O-antigen ligase family protein n=1 Tax=Arthrobacter sp. AOP36-A1-22 TaxID=3457684 RepID=UPI004033DDA0